MTARAARSHIPAPPEQSAACHSGQSNTTWPLRPAGHDRAELRYKAWGEVRYTSGTTPTKYTYTGQYSNVADFGLMFYNARWYDPALGRMAQADSVVPDGVQGYDRYAYVFNSPITYNDPTGNDPNYALRKLKAGYGHYWDEFKASYHRGGNLPDLRPTLNRNAGRGTEQGAGTFGSGSSTNSVCYYCYFNPASDSGASSSFWSGYDPDAVIWGFGFSGSEPGIYNTAGSEEVLMFSDLRRATFNYAGQGSSVGFGASGSAYGGIVFNLENPEDYIGPFATAGGTVSFLDVGLTVSYFWDSGRAPLTPNTTQGVAVGYAPGAQASVWWSSTVYSMTWHSTP